jgi:hypothetical protein
MATAVGLLLALLAALTSFGSGRLERFVSNPQRFGDDVTPTFAAAGRVNPHRLAVFVAASRGAR